MINKLMVCLVTLLSSLISFSQIEAVKVDEGAKSIQLKEAIIAYTMHYDIGYTDLATSVLYKYRTAMIDEAALSVKATSVLPREKQFVWSTPGWPLKYMLENATPQRRQGLEYAIKNKRFALQALAFDIQTESSDLENLVRSMNYSSVINRKYNLPLSREAKMSDVPEHSWVLPTILTHAGVKILHIGCNPGSISPDVPRLFWWEGPDGSRLLTFYWDEYYGSGLLPPKDWKYKTWMAMTSTHENTGPPRPEDVAKDLAEAKKKLPGVNVRIGTMSDFYDAIMKENPEIPVIRGDMPDTWIHGFMSMPREVKVNKLYQRSIYESEGLHTLGQLWKAKTDIISDEVSKATEQMNLFEEHTFGLAMSHGAGSMFSYGDEFTINRARTNYNRAEISWQEKADHIHEVEKRGAMLRKTALQSLTSSVSVAGDKVVVYNSLPWVRSGSVRLFMNIYRKDKTVTALKDVRNNKLIPVYNDDNLLQFYADDIPAMGYSSFIPVFDGQQIPVTDGLVVNEADHVMENNFVRIKFDANKGSIVSCIDKQTKRELVDTESQYGMGEYFHEYFGEEELKRYCGAYVKPAGRIWGDPEMGRPAKGFNFPYEQTRPAKGRWVYQKNNDEIAATYFGEMSVHKPHRYSVTYIIKPQTPLIELVWNIQGKQAEPNPEAGWIALPFKVTNPKFYLGRPGGITDPAKDFVPGTNHDYFFLNTGLAIADKEGFGMGLNTPDAPAVSLERPGLYKFSKTFVPTKSTVFVNLYNTQWGTNFTEWLDGSWTARMYLWPIKAYDNESGLITPMEETRQPLAGFYSNNPAGTLPLTNQGIKVSGKGINVTSFTQMPDEKSYRLRLWEMAGKSGDCEIELPAGKFKTATLCNLRDEIVANAKIMYVKNNRLSIQIKANQPVTLLLR